MDENNENVHIEGESIVTPKETDNTESNQPESDLLDSSTEAKVETPEPATQMKAPSRIKKFFQQALIYLIVIIVAFLAGFLVDHFLRYRPMAEQLEITQTELEEANQQISTLEFDKNLLIYDIDIAYHEVSRLTSKLELAEAKNQFYAILVDINNARIELFLDDADAPLSALDQTGERLEALLPLISETDPQLALSLPRRLDLIISGITRDPETARIDLELFTKDLLILELQLF